MLLDEVEQVRAGTCSGPRRLGRGVEVRGRVPGNAVDG